MSSDPVGKVVIIVGPTAVGKSDLAIALAGSMNAEIISLDSRLLYRGMDIGTAKPSIEERKKVVHHLFDVANPDETWSLGKFNQEVIKNIEQVINKGSLPILVGGTGQYVRSLTEGWDIPQVEPVPVMRQIIEGWAKDLGNKALHKKMSILDPESGQSIQYQNVRRTIRALEVMFTTGVQFSKQRKKTNPIFSFKLIGLSRPRAELYSRIDARIENMFSSGLVEEVRGLLDLGYSGGLPSMSAIGYKETIQYIQGEILLEEVKALMKQKTRQFVRRQANWFKFDDPNIEWYPMTPYPESMIRKSIMEWHNEK